MLRTLIIIPARAGSTRFPMKPLALISGQSLISRVIEIARKTNAQETLVATDDERIEEHVLNLGVRVVRSHETFHNGTERVAGVVDELSSHGETWDWIINVQGDAVVTPPHLIDSLIQAKIKEPTLAYATPAVLLTNEQVQEWQIQKSGGRASGTSVVMDCNGNALYFSKSILPTHRKDSGAERPVHRHVGVYAYSPEFLSLYRNWKQTPLENAESLEQLRALENGAKLKVIVSPLGDAPLWSIDHPEDVQIAERLLMKTKQNSPQKTS